MNWNYRTKMHQIRMHAASAANVLDSAHCHDVPNHIETERQRRLQAKEKCPAGPPSQQGTN